MSIHIFALITDPAQPEYNFFFFVSLTWLVTVLFDIVKQNHFVSLDMFVGFSLSLI